MNLALRMKDDIVRCMLSLRIKLHLKMCSLKFLQNLITLQASRYVFAEENSPLGFCKYELKNFFLSDIK